MAAGRPWYKRAGADFVMATLGMPDSDTKWAYSAIVDMLNDRDRPIADDPGFVCGFTGLSKRRWNVVRAYLLEHGYIVETGDGHLTNPRFQRELDERQREHDEAVEFGRKGGRKSAALRAAGQGRLDLNDDLSPEKVPQESPESRAKVKDKSELRGRGRNKDKDLAQPPPQASRARDRASEARGESNQTNDHTDLEESESGRSIGPNPDLVDLLDAVSEACGYRPVEPGQMTHAIDMVKSWRDAGIDFEAVVLPTIRAVVADSPDPTSSLKRFDKRVRHEHARSKAKPRKGNGVYRPPDSPVLKPEGEDPMFRPVRTKLLELVGPQPYCFAFNSARFEDVGRCHGDKRPLRVQGPDHVRNAILSGTYGAALRKAAGPLGFTDLW